MINFLGKFQKIVLLFLVLISLFSALAAQPVPPCLSGDGLKDWLKTSYYEGKHTTLGYQPARLFMYTDIDNVNDSIYCVYSGYSKKWTIDSSGTNPSPINCEHTVPQSFFSQSEPMRSDIHHLFPTFGNWNSIRSNHPFAEISDQSTQIWMFLDGSSTAYPTSNIEFYSEYAAQLFEPREDHKGNVARAAFYFYTMYSNTGRSITDLADPEVLLQWHLMDPVDNLELERNNAIEFYQGNRNPYIDFPSLVELSWFAGSSDTPDAPISISIVEDLSSLTINWTDVQNETDYYIYRSADSINYTLIDSVPENTISYTDTNVLLYTVYNYYVVPVSSSACGVSSKIVGGSAGPPVLHDGIFIAEYIEGNSFNKALELVNTTGSPVDLSSYDFRLQRDGSGTWISSFGLTGVLQDCEVHVIAHQDADMEILNVADVITTSEIVTFNGNDVIGLFRNDTLVDIVGVFDSGGFDFGKDVTLVREASIAVPNPVYGVGEWDVFPLDDFSHLGEHCDVLPIEFSSFQTRKDNYSVRLDWEIAFTSDAGKFQVLRSNDGVTYQALHTIPKRTDLTNYYFVDESPMLKTNYYKIGFLEENGITSFTNVEAVRFAEPTDDISLFPNPADQEITILSSAAIDHFQVFNSIGTLVLGGSFDKPKIDLSTLPSGIYFLGLFSGEENQPIIRILQKN